MDVPTNITVVQNHLTRPTQGSEQERQTSSSDGVPNLLLKILEACAKHKRCHEHDDALALAEGKNEHNDKRHAKCQQDLQSLARVLPRVEPTICVDERCRDEYHLIDSTSSCGGEEKKIKEHSGEDDVRHLCALYRAIARGAFCPHAAQVLFGGKTGISSIELGSGDDVDLAKGILPRIMRLLGYLIQDPVRTATLPLRSNGEAGLEESVNEFYQEEDIGATIASLLSLLQDVKLLISALHDLINLANDLTTVEDSGVLFDPLTKAQNHNGTESKIRLQVFGELLSHFDKQTDSKAETILHLSSRSSLLSLQLGIWTTLQQFFPLHGSPFCYSGKLTSGDYIDHVGLLNSLMATARPVLQISTRTVHEDQTSGWVYSEKDVNIHSRMVLRTKLVILGFLRSIESSERCSKFARVQAPPLGRVLQIGSASATGVELSLLAIEAAKSHAVWNNADPDFSRDEIEEQLNVLCSWSMSNLLISTLLFPDTNLSSDDWVHTLPYLVDCIPFICRPRRRLNGHECINRIVLRILHAFLHRDAKASTLLMNRCLSQGYFPYLFEMAADAESVSGPAISIIVFLLESSLVLQNTGAGKSIRFLSDALNYSPTRTRNDQNGGEAQDDESKPSVQHERKRRRLIADSPHNTLPRDDVHATSIQATFVHFVKNAINKADDVTSVIDQRLKNWLPEGPKVLSLITEEDLLKLCAVSGVLMILLSVSALVTDESMENTIERLYTCIQKVSHILASHEKDGGICHIGPSILKQALSLITRIGYHSYCVEKSSSTGKQSRHVSVRESISYCVMATLPLVEGCEDSVKLKDDAALTEPENHGYCQHSCSRLCSVFGLKAMPPSDICLCSLADHTNLCFSRECGSFLVNDVLPLECRCILLAAIFPITTDSNQHDTTLTSIQRILADSSRPSLLRSASLVCLPTLFMSLASLKQDQYATSRYLLSIMKSFDFGLVANSCQSDISMLQVAAFLALTRLNQMHTAASLVVSKQDMSLFWNTLDPSKSGIHTVLLRMLHSDESFALMGTNNTDLPSSLNALLNSRDNLPLVHQSPRVFLASHLYLQSTLAVLPRPRLHSLGAYDFFRNREHYSHFDRVALAYSNNEYDQTVLACIPAPVWVLLAPFVAAAPSARRVAENVGPALLRNKCELFSAMFIGKGLETDVPTKESVANAARKFFKQLEYLLIKFFRLPRALILSSVEEDPSSTEESLNEQGLEIAVLIFKSLCQSSSSLDLAIGVEVFQQSLIRLMRIWIGGTSVNCHPTDLNNFGGSPFSSSFDAIRGLFDAARHPIQSLQPIGLVASIFREFFLPCVKDSIPWLRYRILIVFIESCILPISRTQGLPANCLDVPNNINVVGFVDAVFPSVITALIFNEDIECLEMCAAFRMYLISEHKKQSKEEKRVQKRGINEFITGTHLKKDRPSTFSRDLVPGVTIAGSAISTKKLTENMKLLCWKSDVIEYVLPRLLLHSDRSVLKFFADLCPPNISLSEILQRKEQTVLKTLVWELGADDPDEDRPGEIYSSSCTEKRPSRNDVVLALKMGYLIKEGHFLMSASEKSTDGVDDASARLWVGQNFMYLLVNIALHKWNTRSEQEKFQTIKCLKSMLSFLSPDESLQYMPQIIVAISNAMGGSIETSDGIQKSQSSKLCFVAVATLFDFIRIVAAHKVENVGENLISIAVILFPLFDTKQPTPGDIAREEAVKLLVWLAENASSYFNEIPFLPVTLDLQQVRDVLAAKKVHLDDIKLTSQQTDHDGSTIADPQLHSKFYAQMSILSELVATHESKQVRKVVIEHMTKLIEANRDLFHNMIENEGLASVHFLTVVHKEGGSEDNEDSINDGFVTKLLMRLLSRCVDETDRDIRDSIARCLGEIGAIDSNRLGKEIAASQFNTKLMANDNSEAWRLGQPPWNSNITRYELRLVTRHLVWGLKSAATTLDQHKIAFGIQELLKQIDASVTDKSNEDANPEHSCTPMSSWLKDKLDEADVRHIVETFWTSTYQQQEIAPSKKPPFFIKSNSYFSWLSSFSRFMVTKSYSNEKSIWKNLFHSCRSAIRSQAGLSVAEFILPVLILDTICFGEECDQDIVASEIIAALSFEPSSISLMDIREREKTVNSVFNALDVIRHWIENEMEQMPPSPANKSKRGSRQSRNHEHTLDSWPVEESISKISHFIKRIPSSACAIAASSVGMNARALRFLEIESRAKCGLHIGRDSSNAGSGPKHLKSEYVDGIDLELTQTLLGKLNDFDTMVVITQKGHHRQSGLTRRLAEEAAEKELYGDIEGSCQAYEQLLDTRLNRELYRLGAQKGLLRCLLKLGRLDSVINQAYGMSESLNSAREKMFGISDEFLPSAAEAAWRLGNWAVLEKVSEFDVDSLTDASGRHQLSFGRVMHSVHCRSPSKILSSIQEAREHVMTSLSSAARDSYAQSYPYLQALHALRDVEIASSDFSASPSNNKIVSDEWRHRLSFLSPDFTGSNIIMNTRLALSRMSNEHIAEGTLWLDTGKMARKGGLFQVAEQCLTHADLSFCTSLGQASDAKFLLESIGKVRLQFAKLKYALGETTMALNLIEDDVPPSVFHLDGEELESFVSKSKQSVDVIGRLLLQATEWVVSGGLKSGTEIRNRYQTVLKFVPNWERAHFHFGKYLDTLYESCIAKGTGHVGHGADINSSRTNAIGSDEQCQRLLLDSVRHYGVALQLGQKHVYQALPRLLAMWLEFTSIFASSQSVSLLRSQSEMNSLIKSFISKIPEHLFYTALPQLISCILHNNEDSSRNVMHILTTVLSKYPRQAMWACNWLRFSKSDAKKKAGDNIFFGAKKCLMKINGGAKLQGMLDVSRDLFGFLIGLAKHSPKNNLTSVKMKLPEFKCPLTSFIPPVQAALSVTPGALDRADAKDIFPPFVPRMRAFNPELKIMQSKAKPKKVSMFAVPSTVAQRESLSPKGEAIQEDTGEMHFLVKQEAKGDLRKDSRVQDLNNVINRLFAGRKGSSGSDSRRQRLRLHLRTFSVVCLAEDCGILEWVPNTDSFRSLVGGTYNPQVPPNSIHRRGGRITNFNNIELRDAFLKCQDMYFKKGNLIGAAKKFDENILRQYLPIMYWWFIQNFSNPHAWFEARNNFTLSTAVWSAVGHIIGLGDRHSENILLDTRSGECVHVDFDCIFDKGLLLPRPEVIPFRLTPNMIDAFGPTGTDGLYSGALVESMKTLRQNRDTLLSVLEPFLKDPVINFSSSKNQQKSQGGSAKAVESIRKIDGRLKGMYNLENPNYKKVTRRDGFTQDEQDDSSHVAFSVEGQVQRMIREATSHENLVQVYVGWMPWI